MNLLKDLLAVIVTWGGSSLSAGGAVWMLSKHRGLDVVFSCLSEYPAAQVFPVAQTVKNLPAMQETWVFLEKEMATHSRILVWEIPWTVDPGSLYSLWGHKESDTTE